MVVPEIISKTVNILLSSFNKKCLMFLGHMLRYVIRGPKMSIFGHI